MKINNDIIKELNEKIRLKVENKKNKNYFIKMLYIINILNTYNKKYNKKTIFSLLIVFTMFIFIYPLILENKIFIFIIMAFFIFLTELDLFLLGLYSWLLRKIQNEIK
jgi:hypothetical protein